MTHGRAPHLQHQFDSPAQQFDAGKLGMWLFLATEILLFGGLFCAYAVYRGNHPEIFVYAHVFLDRGLGAVNTVILLTSSLTMAWGVRAAQLGQQRALVALLSLTILGGAGFMGIKFVEYKAKWEHGLLWARSYRPASHAAPHTGFDASRAAGPPQHGAAENAPASAGGSPKSPAAVGGAAENVPAAAGGSPKSPAAAGGAAENVPHAADGAAGDAPAAVHAVAADAPAAGEAMTAPASRGNALPAAATVAEVAAPPSAPPGTERSALPPAARGPAGLALPADGETHGGPSPANVQVFFSIYFLMTGLHGLHVLAGMLAIGWILLRALGGAFGPEYFTPVDLVGLYWHLVDLIWIFLFPLLYLIH